MTAPGPPDSMPFAELIGVEVTAATPEEVTARLEWSASRCTAGGVLHGGAVMALADTAGALAAFLNLPETSAGTTTISSSTQFIRALRRGAAIARSRPLHRGRTTIVVETDVEDDEGRLLARVTQTQAVLA